MNRSLKWSTPNLIRALRDFDGKRTDVLEQLIISLPRRGDLLVRMLEIAQHPEVDVQIGATWILKRWFEIERSLFSEAISNLVRLLTNAEHWEVRLHILQILAVSSVPTESIPALKESLKLLYQNENKLLRAWSLSVLVSLADQCHDLRETAIIHLSSADHDIAASVRARTRQLKKIYKWTTSLR